MIGLKIALQTQCLKQPFKQALHTAAQLRCQGVQIDARTELRPDDASDSAVRQLRKMLNDLNLRVASVRFPNRRGYADAQELQRRVDATMDAMRMAARLRAGVVACTLGPLPPEASRPWEVLGDVLSELARLGDRLGVTVALETSASPPDDVARRIETYSAVGLGIDLSPADAILQGRDIEAQVAAFGARIAHVRANDGVRGLGNAQGAYAPLGRGAVDVPRLASLLEELGYRQWIAVEVRESADPVAQASDAVAYLRAL